MRVSFVLEKLLTNQIELCAPARRIRFGFAAKPSGSDLLANVLTSGKRANFRRRRNYGLAVFSSFLGGDSPIKHI